MRKDNQIERTADDAIPCCATMNAFSATGHFKKAVTPKLSEQGVPIVDIAAWAFAITDRVMRFRDRITRFHLSKIMPFGSQ